ncbi:hydroxyacylglutathione hydrolase, mitochondrial [Microplitis demolitor]|uniref:hydroxyacylglutathione hydrolase, mitochondrial n=1 Tax=Microplitis demolitor TaxID=69319 RepID=UPI0004CC9732|nr:hydroxyacylglutathione hydrolase, mitochondrial [Microplitis demolitor]
MNKFYFSKNNLSNLINLKTPVKNIVYKFCNKVTSKMHSVSTLIQGQNMSIKILPALDDNFMYLIIDEKTKEAAIVDPVNPTLVSSAVEEHKVKLNKILTTHHHWDHAGGNVEMCKKFPNIKVFGGDDRVDELTNKVSHDELINIGNLKIKCLSTPCHTSGHICYYLSGIDNDSPAVFTGDTLFIGGCGRFFEGTPEQMYTALIKILGSLPDETKVYCGHEYTCKNLLFGMKVEPSNEDIKKQLEWANNQRKERKPTVPSTIGDEKKFNPFMRVHESSVKDFTGTNDHISTMAKLRQEKDNF